MVTLAPAATELPITHVQWPQAVRVIRSLFPPIDLFEDIADPEDWPLLMSGEQKSNPRRPSENRLGRSGLAWVNGAIR